MLVTVIILSVFSKCSPRRSKRQKGSRRTVPSACQREQPTQFSRPADTSWSAETVYRPSGNPPNASTARSAGLGYGKLSCCRDEKTLQKYPDIPFCFIPFIKCKKNFLIVFGSLSIILRIVDTTMGNVVGIK